MGSLDIRHSRAMRQVRKLLTHRSQAEETYSLAIVFMEQTEAAGRPIKLQIFASVEDGITPARLARFFDREKTGWRATPDLRSAIVFMVQDVLTDPPSLHHALHWGVLPTLARLALAAKSQAQTVCPRGVGR